MRELSPVIDLAQETAPLQSVALVETKTLMTTLLSLSRRIRVTESLVDKRFCGSEIYPRKFVTRLRVPRESVTP